MIFVRAVGEVHADDIETSLAESIDLLGGIGLGPDCADNGGAAVLLGRMILSVELREPLNARAAGVQVVESVGHGDCGRSRVGGVKVLRGRRIFISKLFTRTSQQSADRANQTLQTGYCYSHLQCPNLVEDCRLGSSSLFISSDVGSLLVAADGGQTMPVLVRVRKGEKLIGIGF